MTRPYSLVVVASVPPPVAGQSLATVVLQRQLDEVGLEYGVVNLSRPFYRGSALVAGARRAGQAALFPLRAEAARRRLRRPPMLYLQLGQSTQAMVRDLPLLAWASARRMPVVVHVHGSGFRRAFEAAPKPLRRLIKPLLTRAAAAIVLSPLLESMFDHLIAPQRVVSVANAPEESLTSAAQVHHRERRAGSLTALYLSNMMDAKGYLTVLEAAVIAKERGLDVRFVLAGAITEMASVDPRDYIREHQLDNVDFIGPVFDDDKLEVLRRADVFMLPTWHPNEGQPISILEAMQFGLPIITTRQGGICDIVKDGEHGVLVEPHDPAAITAALESFASDAEMYHRVSASSRASGLTYTGERHGREMLAALDAAFEASARSSIR